MTSHADNLSVGKCRGSIEANTAGEAKPQPRVVHLEPMPSSSTLSTNDRSLIKSIIHSPTKILAASFARIYFAHPDPRSWSYGDLQGALVLIADRARGAHFLTLVDLVGSGGVLWEHEIYKDFEYNQDRPFFHSFPGDVRARTSLSSHRSTNILGPGMHDRYSLSR